MSENKKKSRKGNGSGTPKKIEYDEEVAVAHIVDGWMRGITPTRMKYELYQLYHVPFSHWECLAKQAKDELRERTSVYEGDGAKMLQLARLNELLERIPLNTSQDTKNYLKLMEIINKINALDKQEITIENKDVVFELGNK